ncbi:conserved Plasmodium protein, unknown function [Plasmodium berghei]|uniref:Uncharacterized protein n=2 Tax=Plasmodium berghei TaxID=5821 RepID=A0A509AFD0_PLABA|nr:conserved Plasmodium protein, unknown function [Plasmodium berghei ANKA]CXI14896.1 conserved Plasmodium protein, unknown function [Plasmodium berghei]SCM19535.1 conserved Plasmodium protein, unknown function [Plasmodium berghei]SCN23272.1 conserved Plasmodium protein, unknown function [Plasmodium berghei]SCO58997.1 conserved Plasmodium protein, unknown function [Plasmodium berghei]SCO59498.1 conserved Plasmodium protein, unknown function [Plasmodium berghei]|eukprot:XP_034420508.1 conserved Plasmodium protein, unknown function [Plasmodium berghei ANKA]
MKPIKNENMYNDTQKRAIIFFTLSLFCNFIKIILLLFDALVAFLSIILCLLFMFFGYFGIVSSNPSYTEIYIAIVYVDIMLNFLIAFIPFYNILTIPELYIKKTLDTQSNDLFFYIVSIVLIVYSFVSTLLNSLSIYHSKKLIKPILMYKENNTKIRNNFPQNNGAIGKQEKKKIKNKNFKGITKLGSEHKRHEMV